MIMPIGHVQKIADVQELTALSPSPSAASISSLAPSTTISASLPLRPQLAPPQSERHFFLHVLDLHNQVEECFGKYLCFIRDSIRSSLAELERLNAKKLEELQKYAKTACSSNTWSFISSVAHHLVTYAVPAALGAAFIATGVNPPIGYLLIAAGGLGFLSESGIGEAVTSYFTQSKEMQEKVETLVSNGLSCLSIGLGLVGGVGIWKSDGLRMLHAAMGTEQSIEQINVGLGLATAGAKARESWATKQMMSASAALKVTDGAIFLTQKTMVQNSAKARDIIQSMQILTDQIKQAHF